jgi:sugar phosphate isomerase/epimerase
MIRRKTTMSNFFALELYSVRKDLRQDLWGTLRKVKKMGYEAVEFFGHFTHTAQELKAALDDTGLLCCGWHTPWGYVQDDTLMSTITYNKIIGNTDIVIPGLPQELTDSKEAWIKTAGLFNGISDKLADYGMHLGYHNHASEFKPMGGDIPYNYFYENTVNVGMQLDNGNALSAGGEVDIYEGVLKRFPGRAKTIHLKPWSFEKGYACMIGEDDIDYGKFFDLCYEYQDVEWFIVEYECESLYTPLDGVEKCLKALWKLEDDGVI